MHSGGEPNGGAAAAGPSAASLAIEELLGSGSSWSAAPAVAVEAPAIEPAAIEPSFEEAPDSPAPEPPPRRARPSPSRPLVTRAPLSFSKEDHLEMPKGGVAEVAVERHANVPLNLGNHRTHTFTRSRSFDHHNITPSQLGLGRGSSRTSVSGRSHRNPIRTQQNTHISAAPARRAAHSSARRELEHDAVPRRVVPYLHDRLVHLMRGHDLDFWLDAAPREVQHLLVVVVRAKVRADEIALGGHHRLEPELRLRSFSGRPTHANVPRGLRSAKYESMGAWPETVLRIMSKVFAAFFMSFSFSVIKKLVAPNSIASSSLLGVREIATTSEKPICFATVRRCGPIRRCR